MATTTITRTITVTEDMVSGIRRYLEFLFDEPIVLLGSYTAITSVTLSTNGGLTMANTTTASQRINSSISIVLPDGTSYSESGQQGSTKIPTYSNVATPISATWNIASSAPQTYIQNGVAGIRLYDGNVIYDADEWIMVHAGYEVTITFQVTDQTIFYSSPIIRTAETVGPRTILTWTTGQYSSINPIKFRLEYKYREVNSDGGYTLGGYLDGFTGEDATFNTPTECYGKEFFYLIEAYDAVTSYSSGYTVANVFELYTAPVDIFYNDNGVWVECIPYCYVDGEWVRCIWNCGPNWTTGYQAWGYKYVQDL